MSASSQILKYISVLDSVTSEPIAFVIVKYAHNTIIGNANGEFQIPIQNNEVAQNDSLTISALGYRTYKRHLNTFLHQKSSKIFLSAQAIALDEIVVNPISIQQLLADAVNHSSEKLVSTVVLSGYYREVVKRDGMISKYADGLIDYYIDPDKKNRLDISTFVTASRVKELKLDDEDEKYDGLDSRINISVLPSFIRPSRATVLDSNEFDKYQYQLMELNGVRSVYKISFKPKVDSKVPLYEGAVYIDRTTNLILGVNYKFVPTEQFKTIKTLSLLGITLSLTNREVQVRYHIDDQKYYPLYASVSAGLAISSKKVNQTNGFKSEFITTKFKNSEIEKTIKGAYKKNYLYKNGNDYAKNFWESIKSNSYLAEEEAFLNKKE